MRHALPKQQQGAAVVIAAVLLFTLILILGQSALRMMSTDITDSALNSDSAAALFLAESGLERAAGAFAATGNCDSTLAGGPYALGNGTFSIINIGAGFTQDFSGTGLPSTRCHIRATGTAGVLGASRIIEAIIENDPNLLGSNNPDFNEPPGSCVYPSCIPDGWSLPNGGWDDTGGPDGSRAAYVVKAFNGPSEFTTAGSFNLSPFTVTAPTTLTLTFDYKVSNGNSPQEMYLEFELQDTTGKDYSASPDPFKSGKTSGFVTGTVSIPITGSGSVTITQAEFKLKAKSGLAKEIWLDNLNLTGAAGTGTAEFIYWQEVWN